MARASGTLAKPSGQANRGEVMQAVLELVQEQGLKVGDKLPSIREMAEALAIKPSLVRDALLQAQSQGLVRILPRAGAFLQSFAPVLAQGAWAANLQRDLQAADANLFHLLDARRLLEIELAGRAAERRRLEDLLPVRQALEAMLQLPQDQPGEAYAEHDIRFHVEIARLAGNSVLFAMQQTLMELLRSHLQEVPLTPDRRSRTDRSHAAIYAALVAGDAVRTRAAMADHLNLAYDSLLRDLQKAPTINGLRPGKGQN